MRHSPSMVPFEGSGDTYLVLEDLGHLGRVWRETDGAHNWLVWREYLAEILPQLFRDDAARR